MNNNPQVEISATLGIKQLISLPTAIGFEDWKNHSVEEHGIIQTLYYVTTFSSRCSTGPKQVAIAIDSKLTRFWCPIVHVRNQLLHGKII